MKILYAAGDREAAHIQLLRFLQATSSQKYYIKIAAYRPANVSVDWNLESLKDIFSPQHLMFKSDKLNLYYEQVKYFDPDIVISDLEIYTSHIAIELGKPLWQVSPNLLHFSTPKREKSEICLYKKYPHLFSKEMNLNWIKNIIFNSDKKLVYSHLGDTGKIRINEGFEWVRPYHVQGKHSVPCQHNVVAAMLHNNKKLIDHLKKYRDTVIFSKFLDEEYRGIILKDIYNQAEYECNLKNCNLFVNQGHNDLLADAFYNGKHSIIMPNFKEQECIVNSMYSKWSGLADVVYDNNIIDIDSVSHEAEYNPDIKYLHQHLEAL